MTPAELLARMQDLHDRLESRAARDSSNAMALTFQAEVVASMHGPAPSPPGTPPARRSGTLARSVRTDPAAGGGPTATASVAPHTVYARIQQLGGNIHVVRAKVLTDGKTFFGKHVYLPPRPYMVMNAARGSRCRSAAVRAVQAVIDGG